MKLHPPLAAHFEAHQAATRLPGLSIEHYAIGLAEEAAEVLEATEPTDVDIAPVQEECGDLLWYLVGIMRCANLSTADLFQCQDLGWRESDHTAAITRAHPLRSNAPRHRAVDLVLATGRLLHLIKRGRVHQRVKMTHAIGSVMQGAAAVLMATRLTLADAMRHNMHKLAIRRTAQTKSRKPDRRQAAPARSPIHPTVQAAAAAAAAELECVRSRDADSRARHAKRRKLNDS